jgi:four helix bundle protein
MSESQTGNRNQLGKVQNRKELLAYEKAYELVLLVYKMTHLFPKEEVYGLTSQMRRCAVSIPSNIAEGYMRGSKEYVQFLKISLGSAAELETQLAISKDLVFSPEEMFRKVYDLNEDVIKLLKSYVSRLSDNRKERGH